MSVKKHLCGPCFEEECEIEGVVFCRECDEPLCGQCKLDHARIKVSKNHKMCDLADVPPQEVKELLRNLIICPNHGKEEVVYLCKDHDVTCCSKCAMADHRKCEEVKVLSDIVHDMNMDCTTLSKMLLDLHQRGEILLEHERKQQQLVSEIESRALSSLKTIKQKLLDMYAQLEHEVLSAIADKKKVIGEKIERSNEQTIPFFNEIEQQSTYIEHVEKFGTPEHVFLLQRQLNQNAICCLKSTVGDLENNRSQSSVKCVEDTSFDSLLIEIKNSLRIEDYACDARTQAWGPGAPTLALPPTSGCQILHLLRPPPPSQKFLRTALKRFLIQTVNSQN
ncbi:hypothetical protein DPMN_156493 [Dreissena polymorpha]|uniref:B box-type domain-containing protein n=1 Tax=Dreissena polymorpha TaxID=45954 RepID=A0A9D4FPX0_DREPO|nr:hypothetical protein DPMN_156493 [Dreissena polymorpha]